MNGEDNMNEYFDEHDRFLHYDLFREILKSTYFYVLDWYSKYEDVVANRKENGDYNE